MTGIVKLIWMLAVYGTCTYLVFWMDHSGWWYLLAMVLAGGVTLKFNEAKK